MVLLESESLAVGKFKAPDFNLDGIDGKNYSLSAFTGKIGLVVVFTCNHCPYAQAAWPILISLAEEYQSKGVGFVAINPNDGVLYPEDSMDSMKKRALGWGVNFPYLQDKLQNIAVNYKAVCTPDIYVFDKERKLYYHGRINDNWQNPERVKSHDLKNAIEGLLAGNDPSEKQYPSMGCSIKWSQ